MLMAIVTLTVLGLTLGWLLGLASRYLKVECRSAFRFCLRPFRALNG
jgi:Na+-translocating ferredoxin:NAD+ oxidoreductase RNF subunit RnfB